MSEPRVTVGQDEAGAGREEKEAESAPLNQPSNEASRPGQLRLPSGSRLPSAEPSPSPSAEGSGLLSLPWEMVARIASHLPAQCVITVLPQVCHALGNVGKDSTAWQLRACRLTGPRASFPVGPRDGFDWPSACLEMEELITCWTGQGERAAREAEQAEREREVERAQERERDREALAEEGIGEWEEVEEGRPQVDEGIEVEEVGFRVEGVMAVPWDGEELMEEGEMQQDGGGDLPMGVGEGEERQEAAAEAMMEEERDDEQGVLEAIEVEERDDEQGVLEAIEVEERDDEQGVLEAIEVEERVGVLADRDGQDYIAGPKLGGEGERNGSSCPPSPPPALERLSLPSGHIAEVNSVLLVGGEGAVCASGSRDRNVNLWDLREGGSTGRLLHTLGGQGLFSTHKGWVWCLAARGPLLASGSFDSTVRLWDLGAQGAERGLIRARAAVLCLALPQTDVLLAGTYDKKVSVYDTRVAEPLVKSLRLHSNAVLCLVADEQYILSGSKDCTVVIYDRRAGKTLQKLQLGSYLLSMCYSGSEVWAGDNRGMLHAFSMQAGSIKPLSQFDVGHTSLVTGIHRSPGSLYTCSADRTIKVHLPCAPPRTLCTLHHQAGVNGLSVEAGVLAIASGEMCVEVWRARR
ncbi:F-box/WD repeat-containing protein 9 isoform X1 [Coregonus clupeaformis]|uniref:F-box/WD repeat-containing protein 9 isoform X1 n=1 Tax=Coregonus clupeaformis TaxID=59861 RepID=UPI001BDFCCF6|nr:F-box/WD repeat-containing protein 9 isoform X1 [Coregonus clupeaformis]